MRIPLTFVVLALILAPQEGVSQSALPNAHPTRDGWECNRGYRQVGDSCEVVQVPANARLDILGHDWECNRGFQQVRGACAPVAIPPHAHLDILGHAWECDRGFRESGNGCQPIVVPKNAQLDILGHDWECDRGYRSTGPACEAVVVPEHAHLDVLGHEFECDDGYKRAGKVCTAMTEAEREAQRILKQQIRARYAAGWREWYVDGDCDGESVTGVVEGHKGSGNVTGTLEYDNGHEVGFEGEWIDAGEIEGTDEFGNYCTLQVQ